MYCNQCKKEIAEGEICSSCGKENEDLKESVIYTFSEYKERKDAFSDIKQIEYSEKSRICAGILQLFCGCLGFGRFYTEYHVIGVLQILASLATCGIGGVVWGFVDAIMFLTGKIKYDGMGKMLI